MILTVNDLVYINEAAKCLKHRLVAVRKHELIGVDNIKDYISFTPIDVSMLSNKGDWPEFILDTRELSAFITTITVESQFEVIDAMPRYISTTSARLFLNTDVRILNMVNMQYSNVIQLRTCGNRTICEKNIDTDLERIKAMKKADGELHMFFDKYFVTLFSGLLPMAKADHVFLTIYDNSPKEPTFVAEYEVRKKKFSTFIFVAYLKI